VAGWHRVGRGHARAGRGQTKRGLKELADSGARHKAATALSVFEGNA
jgi:hypothetical protein